MAYGDVSVTAATWVQLTDADATSFRVQNTGSRIVRVQATLTTSPPANGDGGVDLRPGDMLPGSEDLTKVYGGLSATGPYRLWGYAEQGGLVSVSDA